MLILPMSSNHDRKSFDCGEQELNVWFSNVSRQHKEKGISSTFVAVSEKASINVIGFYAVSMAELLNSNLPIGYSKKMPLKIPVFRLGRLAIDKNHQGKGIGEFLLFDAIDRLKRISEDVGGFGVVVNAKTTAIGFYERYGFEKLEDHPQNLILRF